MKIFKKIIEFFYYLLFTFIYIGFWCHDSYKPVVLNYSVKYFIFLILLLIFYFIPFLLKILINKIGRKKFYFTVTPMFILIIIIYIFSSYHYYYTRQHLFNPYLQAWSPRIPKTFGPKTVKDYRILTLGGSTTGNVFLKRNERYPYLMQKKLQKKYSQLNIQVFNSATAWFTTKHSLINYVTYCNNFKPDLVIIMHAINDLTCSFSPPLYAVGGYQSGYTHYYGAAINGANPPTFETFLIRHPIVVDLILSSYSKYKYRYINYPLSRYKSLKDFKNYYSKLVYYIKKDNADIVLVSQASLYKKNPKELNKRKLRFRKRHCSTYRGFTREDFPSELSLYNAMKEYNRITRDLAQKENLLFIDAAEHIKKTYSNFVDDVHYTPNGAEKLANIITESILQHHIIKNKN